MKKIIGVLLVVCLLVGATPMAAAAQLRGQGNGGAGERLAMQEPQPVAPSETEPGSELTAKATIARAASVRGSLPTFPYGVGSASDPFEIRTQQDLLAFAAKCNSENGLPNTYTIITQNIALSYPAGNGVGHVPIANFAGNLNGQGYTISGLWMNRSGSDNTGLFIKLTGSALIEDVHIQLAQKGKDTLGNDVDAIRGRQYTGVLVGSFQGGEIKNCTVIGPGTITGTTRVSALAGTMTGSAKLTDCAVTNVTISASGSRVGGLAGDCNGTGKIINSRLTNATVGATNDGVGGIVGYMVNNTTELTGAIVSDSNISGVNYVGGVAGYGIGAVSGCTVKSDTKRTTVTGTGNHVGGVVGSQSGTAYAVGTSIDDCTASGIAVSGTYRVGGVAGYVIGSIHDSRATSNANYPLTVTATATTGTAVAGGVVGYVQGTITDSQALSYAANRLTVSGDRSHLGGLVGVYNNQAVGTVTGCSVKGVEVTGAHTVGGLIGHLANGHCGTQASGNSVGDAGSLHTLVTCTGEATGNAGSAGGLIGFAEKAASVIAYGTVTNVEVLSAVGSNIGGLVGQCRASVSY